MTSPPTRSGGRVAAMLEDRRTTLVILAVIIAGFLAFGVGWGLTHHEAFIKPTGDGVYYEIMVKQLLTRGVYAYKNTEANAVITPGYPLFLAGVYEVTGRADRPAGPYRLIYWIQLLFGAGSIALTYLIGSDLLGRGPGLTAALLVALYPPVQQSALKLLTEPLALMLFLAYVYVQLLAIRRGGKLLWLATGLLLGATVMVRPAFLFVGVVPLVYVLVTRREWRPLLVQAGLVAAGFAIVVAPWVARNAVVLGSPVLLRSGASTGEPMLAGVDPYHWEAGYVYRYAGPSYHDYKRIHQGGMGPYPPGYDVTQDVYAVGVIGRMLREQPARLIEWFTLGKIRSMFTRLWEGGDQTTASVTWVTQIAVVAFGFMGMVLAVKEERFRLLTFMILVGVASLLPFVAEPRFVFGYMPLLAVLAAGVMKRAWSLSDA